MCTLDIQDAEKAVAHGIEGIVVSNHGTYACAFVQSRLD